MNKPINNITQLHERSKEYTPPTRFTVHGDRERPVLLNNGQFSFLFVLQGELVGVFSGGHSAVVLTAPQMISVDKHQLRALRCVGNTMILECVISDTMTPLMQSISRAFKKPYSEKITLNSTLNAWCKTLISDLSKQPDRDNNYFISQCSKLTALLLKYPHNVLGTLYIPLYTCSKHCQTCTKQFVQSDGVIE